MKEREKMTIYTLNRIAKDRPEVKLDLSPEDLDIIVDALYDMADINGCQRADELWASLTKLQSR